MCRIGSNRQIEMGMPLPPEAPKPKICWKAGAAMLAVAAIVVLVVGCKEWDFAYLIEEGILLGACAGIIEVGTLARFVQSLVIRTYSYYKRYKEQQKKAKAAPSPILLDSRVERAPIDNSITSSSSSSRAPISVRAEGNKNSAEDPMAALTLQTAISSGNTDAIERAFRTLRDINATDHDGHSALYSAVWMGRADLVKHLLTLGANPQLRDKNGDTALHVAMLNPSFSSIAVVDLLLMNGVDIHERGEHGTAVTYAIRCKNGAMARELIRRGAIVEPHLCEQLQKLKS